MFGELLLRKPILPGNDSNHQLDLIFNLIGTPSDEDIEAIPNPISREKVSRLHKKPSKLLQTIFRDANPDALDLLRKMLSFNPEKRITVQEALEHAYLSTFHCEEDEPTTTPVSLFDFEFERQHLTMRQLKDLIYEEILLYHFPLKKEEYEKQKAEYDLVAQQIGRVVLKEFEEDEEELN